MYQYDLIIVGSGLYGAVVAYMQKRRGLRVLVLERRSVVGGNIRDEWNDGICVHMYGAHIFHTDMEDVWRFVNTLSPFDSYQHLVLARSGGRLYHLPISMQTMYEVYGITNPSQMTSIFDRERQQEHYDNPMNLEEQAINLVGRTLYELLIKGYTEKQWGCKASHLPASIINRLPIRKTFNTDYFDNSYQGIPRNGYSHLISQLLRDIEVKTNVDFNKEKGYWLKQARHIVYTGMTDELGDYELGNLEYRSLIFEHQRLETDNFQGCAVVNEVDKKVPYTRTIEHRNFHPKSDVMGHTVITREYPATWRQGREAYYPINNIHNNLLYQRYSELIHRKFPQISLGGRLGLYRYLDMDAAISLAMNHKLTQLF